MGGKHKQAQRVKNNARPSSSGRSAELLGSNITPFMGFSSMKESSLSLPPFSLTEEFDSSVDTNFQLVLKKMNKKDATTKLKALQEFCELVKGTEVEAVKAILPFWPRLYCVLATDIDHKVREATHISHHQVVLKVKRNLAPFLKQLAGPWFTSQYDTYAPAASAAVKAFQDAFPQNKYQEAVVFCQEEILSYICDNLTVQNVQTLNSSKTMSQETAEAKYQRIVISSLQGYSLYLSKTPCVNIQAAQDLNIKILSNPKFWKFSKSKEAPVKAAWFGVITALCQKASFLIEKEPAKIVESIFGNLDESDAIVMPVVWEAVLSIISAIQDWWQYVNVEKVVLPKLYKVLKEGGQGNAAVIFPNLLPLVSHLTEACQDNKNVYYAFFENLRIGMKNKGLLASRSNIVAVSVAFVECFQYVTMKYQSDFIFCQELIDQHLFPILEYVIKDLRTSYKAFFTQIAILVQHWNRNKNVENTNYLKYSEQFWLNLNELFLKVLEQQSSSNNLDALSIVMEKELQFILLLKQPTKVKKTLKVNFILDEATSSDLSVEKIDDSLDQDYNEKLNSFVIRICEYYINYINQKQNKELIEYLVTVLKDFENEIFLKNLSFKLGNIDGSLFAIHANILLKWMENENLSCRSIVDFQFVLFKYLNQTERLELLNSFFNLKSSQREVALSWCVSRALSHPHNLDPVIGNWLRQENVNNLYVSIVDKELKNESSPELFLILKQAFTEAPSGELYLETTATSQIISKLTNCLYNPTNYALSLDKCASFAAYISSYLCMSSTKIECGSNLVVALFSLSTLSDGLDSEILTQDTAWEVETAWQDAVGILCVELNLDKFIVLANCCFDIIKDKVISEECTVERAVDVVAKFLSMVRKNSPLRVEDVIIDVFYKFNELSEQKKLTSVCVEAEYITGNLCSPYSRIKQSDSEDIKITDYLQYLELITSLLIRPIIVESENEYEEEDFHEICLINTISFNQEVVEVILDIVYSITLAQSYTLNFQAGKNYAAVETLLNNLIEKTKALIRNLNNTSKNTVESSLIKKVLAEGWLWCKSLHIYFSQISPQKLDDIFIKVANKIETKCDTTSLCILLHLTQVFSQDISGDKIFDRQMSPVELFVSVRSMIQRDNFKLLNAELFSTIKSVYRENISLFNFDMTNGVPSKLWTKIEAYIEIMRLLSSLLEYRVDIINSHGFWDFIVVTFATTCSNINKIKDLYADVQITSAMISLNNLFKCVNNYLVTNENQEYQNEWQSIFAFEVHKNLIEIWIFMCEKNLDLINFRESTLIFLSEFGTVTNFLNHSFIINGHQSDDSLKWSKLLKLSFSLLTHRVATFQLWGYKMLMTLLPGLIELDFMAVDTHTPHKKGLIIERFKAELDSVQEVVHTMLLDFKLGEDSCRVKPFTDSYTYTFAYLLTWDIILNLCERSSTELRYQYADWLRNNGYLNNLLDNVFKLMPIEIMQYHDLKAKSFFNWFTNKFIPTEISASECIEQMVCWIYCLALSQLPALVRQWWSNVETRTAQIVERVTSVFVSQYLCNQEFTDISQHDTKFKNMVVKIHPSVREVVAIYTVDDSQMELVITLPSNYPLGGPDVQCNRQICGTSHRQWLMQLKMCVLHQNGRIWDGLSLWNNNLDKKFDGVEECYICFAVLHQGTYQMPKLCCQTCRKKFHSACLYKWFSTSNKSTCPICRNLF